MLVYLRSALFLLLFWGSVVVFGSLIVGLARVLTYRQMARLGRTWAHLVLWLLKRVCGLDYRVTGREHLPAGPAVVLCNHQSTWETIALRTVLPLEHTWVLKQELLRIPFFGWAMRRFEPIAIDRSAGRQALRRLLSQGAAHLANGRWVVVFPEGTRVQPGSAPRFNIGGALLAQKAGVPVVPIAHNAGLFWGRHQLRKYPGCIELRVGPPIPVAERSPQQLNAAAEGWIRETLAVLPQARPAENAAPQVVGAARRTGR